MADCLALAQQYNRQDGLLEVSITSLDNRKKATFCAIDDRTDPDRDRVCLLPLADNASSETSLCTSLCNSCVGYSGSLKVGRNRIK